jgi:hypothetical protein
LPTSIWKLYVFHQIATPLAKVFTHFVLFGLIPLLESDIAQTGQIRLLTQVIVLEQLF